MTNVTEARPQAQVEEGQIGMKAACKGLLSRLLQAAPASSLQPGSRPGLQNEDR